MLQTLLWIAVAYLVLGVLTTFVVLSQTPNADGSPKWAQVLLWPLYLYELVTGRGNRA